MKTKKGCYDNIIELDRPESDRRKMTNLERAAQFSSFAALSGLDAKMAEESRLTEEFAELAPDELEALNFKLVELMEQMPDCPYATFTYFEKDAKKKGGRYVDYKGKLKKVDRTFGTLSFEDGKILSVKLITDIKL